MKTCSVWKRDPPTAVSQCRYLDHDVWVSVVTFMYERFAFLVARHCALHCFVDIHFLLLHSWLNKLVD